MANWYPASAMRHLKRPVLVRWGWVQPFEAILLTDNPRRWAAVIRDKKTRNAIDFVVYPPKKVRSGFLLQRTTDETASMSESQYDRWGPEPAAWRPMGAWPDPLPDPLPTTEVGSEIRMKSIGKVAFDATAAAEEMEADREDARRGGSREVDDFGRWWRDGSRIRYRPAGQVQVEPIREWNTDAMRMETHMRNMAEGRVMRAVSFCGAGHGLSQGQVAVGRFLSDLAASVESSDQLVRDGVVPFEPLRQDHDDFLTAMEWFAKLHPGHNARDQSWSLSREQQVLLFRSLTVPLSFADIGRQKAFQVSGTRARAIYESTIDRVHRLANASAGVDPVILRVRERNRAARRASA